VTIRIETGDCIDVLRGLPDCLKVNCCVTSPPYFGLRDYGHAGQIGLEPTPDEYVAKLVEVFREVRRLLRDDGTVWLNLGDSYAANRSCQVPDGKWTDVGNSKGMKAAELGAKPKDLLGIPWRVAFALQADGWYLRSDIIWHKPNPMPESVTDRPTKAHEYIFLLSKSPRYYYDAAAIAEDTGKAGGPPRVFGAKVQEGTLRQDVGREFVDNGNRNRRTVWTVPTSPYSGAHFATFPPDLIEPCILAGCPPDGTVLDPFGGAGTTGLVADRLQRNALLIELNPEYAEMARNRITGDAPLFAEVV
jgi:DNA modification methylase